jgi:translation initiation factor 2 alpha subunit (eIF-2alpha)
MPSKKKVLSRTNQELVDEIMRRINQEWGNPVKLVNQINARLLKEWGKPSNYRIFDRPFYTIEETMDILGMSRSQINKLVTKGMLTRRKVIKKVYFTRESIVKLVMGEES